MQAVFISSIQSGFEHVRAAARAGVESVGDRVLMAELAGASVSSPQRALLDLVASADVLLLIIFPRYGAPQSGGVSATEEEFNEARRLGKPILVLRQRGDLELEQEQFLRRATGGWEEGRLYQSFDGANDVGLAVVRALIGLRELGTRAELEPAASETAATLARGDRPIGYSFAGGAILRVVLVPLLAHRLIDAVALAQPTLVDDVSEMARRARLVSQQEGITPQVAASGITLTVGPPNSGRPTISIGPKGELVVEADVATSTRNIGSMLIDPVRVEQSLRAAVAFADDVWQRLDERSEIQDVACAIAIPGAQQHVWDNGHQGNSISMGSHRMPDVAIAPEPALVIRRVDLARDEMVRSLVAELRRVFADNNAIAGP